tara:strand:+ start:267 stop:959 length:693 start_codon:yes stop_codon:yes gene_type:complete
MLGLGNGISSSQYVSSGLWLPSDEGSLEAWYRFNTGITLNGSNVQAWADSSSNSFAMRQADADEQPAFSAGVLTFDPSSDTQNLQSSNAIELDGEFVLGFKINPAASNVVVMGSNSVNNEMFKLLDNTSTEKIRIKNDAGVVDFELSSGTVLDDAYWVISRDGSDNITVFKDGSAVAAAQSRSGTFDINALGIRNSDTNPYDGTMKEVVIFKGESSTTLINNVSSRLSGL